MLDLIETRIIHKYVHGDVAQPISITFVNGVFDSCNFAFGHGKYDRDDWNVLAETWDKIKELENKLRNN